MQPGWTPTSEDLLGLTRWVSERCELPRDRRCQTLARLGQLGRKRGWPSSASSSPHMKPGEGLGSHTSQVETGTPDSHPVLWDAAISVTALQGSGLC